MAVDMAMPPTGVRQAFNARWSIGLFIATGRCSGCLGVAHRPLPTHTPVHHRLPPSCPHKGIAPAPCQQEKEIAIRKAFLENARLPCSQARPPGRLPQRLPLLLGSAQYALAKMATSLAGCPVRKQVMAPPWGWSKGKQRSVAEVSSLICVSCASLPAHGPRAHLPARGQWGQRRRRWTVRRNVGNERGACHVLSTVRGWLHAAQHGPACARQLHNHNPVPTGPLLPTCRHRVLQLLVAAHVHNVGITELTRLR